MDGNRPMKKKIIDGCEKLNITFNLSFILNFYKFVFNKYVIIKKKKILKFSENLQTF